MKFLTFARSTYKGVGQLRILTPELRDWIHEFVVNNAIPLES